MNMDQTDALAVDTSAAANNSIAEAIADQAPLDDAARNTVTQNDPPQHRQSDIKAFPQFLPEFVPMTSVRTDGGTQARTAINNTVVEEYAEALRQGAKLPAIDLYFDKESDALWLADGFHRFYAHRLIGSDDVLAVVRAGTRRDAILHAAGANAAHGLRRSNEDKRRAVQMLLDDSECAQWSDNAVAKACGVSHPFVASVRAAILKPLQDSPAEASDADCTNNAGSPTAPATRTVIRNGKPYQQKAKVKPTSAAVPTASSDMDSGTDPQLPSAPVLSQGEEVENLQCTADHAAVSNASMAGLAPSGVLVPNTSADELQAEAMQEIKRLTAQAQALKDEHKAELQREMAARRELERRLDEVLEKEDARDEQLRALGKCFAELSALLGVAGAKNIIDRVRTLIATPADSASEADLDTKVMGDN